MALVQGGTEKAETAQPFWRRETTLTGVVLAGSAFYAVKYLIQYFTRQSWGLEEATDWIGSDFFVFWAAARYVMAGFGHLIYDIPAFTHFELQFIADRPGLFYPWTYPPHALFAVLPFGLLPYAGAYFAWIAATFGLYVGLGTGLRPRPVMLAALVVSPATIMAVSAGQTGFLTAGLLIGGLLLVDRRPMLAGLLFGILTIKPQLGLLVPIALAAAGLWRPFVAAAVTGSGLMALSIAAFGVDAWMAQFAAMGVFQQTVVALGGQFAQLQPTVFTAMRLLGAGPRLAYAVQGLVCLFVAIAIFRLYRRGQDRAMQAAAVGFGALLVTPYGFNYDIPVVALSIVLAAARGLKNGFLPGERLVLILLWAWPALMMALNPVLPIGPLLMLAALLMTARRALAPMPASVERAA